MQLLSETKILWKEKKVSVGLSSAIRQQSKIILLGRVHSQTQQGCSRMKKDMKMSHFLMTCQTQAMNSQLGFIKYCIYCLCKLLLSSSNRNMAAVAKIENVDLRLTSHQSICHSLRVGNMSTLGDQSRKLNSVLSINSLEGMVFSTHCRIAFQKVQFEALYRKIQLEKYCTIHP